MSWGSREKNNSALGYKEGKNGKIKLWITRKSPYKFTLLDSLQKSLVKWKLWITCGKLNNII